jgi:ribose 5-phosphate isomerase
MDILFIDEDKWFVTEEGSTILDLVGNTAIANSLLEEKIKKIEEILEAVKSDNPDSFIGWA